MPRRRKPSDNPTGGAGGPIGRAGCSSSYVRRQERLAATALDGRTYYGILKLVVPTVGGRPVLSVTATWTCGFDAQA